MENKRDLTNLQRLVDVIASLRGPGGCPWDKEQDHKSLRKYLLNESYELIDAIDKEDYDEMCEELGDVLLQVVLHSQIASESGRFDINDVARTIADKIVKRHPHVFGDIKVKDSAEVVFNWEEIKSKEKPERLSVLDSVPVSAPALMRAEMISKKAVKVGFEWPNIDMLWDTFNSEIEEFKEAIKTKEPERMQDELGDILFSLVNLARWYKINPEFSLQNTNKKFIERFHLMEQNCTKGLSECSQEELEALWQEAKKIVK